MKRPPNTFSRREVHQRLSVSITQVIRWEKEGVFTPTRDEEGRVWISCEQVTTFAATWTKKPRKQMKKSTIADRFYRGEKAALLFPYFRHGASLPTIVEETKTDPMLVRELYDEYLLDLEGGRQEREKRAEQEREERRQHLHNKKLERAEVRKQQVRVAEILARGGYKHLPPSPTKIVQQAQRDAGENDGSGRRSA